MSSDVKLVFSEVSYAVRGTELVSALSFRTAAGAPTVVLGPNGAGKSLSLRLAHGLLEPTAGRVQWGGGGRPPRQAMLFERPVLLRRTARANVEYALALAGRARSERSERARTVLEKTGLLGLADRSARALSAGEGQRLALARAWATEPEVLFLDEPTAALDPSATKQVEELVQRIAEAGTKIIMTTHDLGQARRLAGEVLFLHGGRLAESGSASDFFGAPSTEEARAFLEGRLLW